MVKQKVLLSLSISSVLLLGGCVSEQTYVGTDRPVANRTFDNIEAARTRISLGLNYLRRGDSSQAKYNLERARSFAPNSAEVYSALAYYYQMVGENKQAENYFREAISKDANYADAYNNYGAFLCQLERYDEAEQLLLKAISRPGYIRVAESYENLALCQLQQNNFTKAKTYLDNSTSHNSTRITSLTLSAGLSYAMGDNREAKALLDRIQRLGRVSARTVLLSYLIADKNGDQDTLRNAEQLLLTLYTDTPEARLLLQQKLQDSEFEQLRERYKDSLMANIVVPDETATKPELPAQPTANPKLKIVKRKTADDSSTNANTSAASSQTGSSASVTTASALPAVKAPTAVVSQAAAVQALPTETELLAEAKALAAHQEEAEKQEALALQQLAQQEAQAQQAEPAPVSTQPSVQPPAEQEVSATAQTTTQTELAEPEVTAEIPATQPTDITAGAAATVVAEATLAETIFADTTIAETTLVETTEPADPATDEEVTTDATVASEAIADTAVTADIPFHIVQQSESLYAISVKHNIRLQRLMQWNQLTPDSVIKTGQKIWLAEVSDEQLKQPVTVPALPEREQATPQQPYHTVAAGETMFGISYRYNVRLSSFMQWNNLTEQSTLKVGQQVLVVDPASVEP
ncbi:type IV pilus biogenesis/stability protein PilW [Rheinheimera fenheensis]|uniref:type IV pilus biogenesis/stability protein PilW n=1 Tax=Rheinheimera fenheensis TaxID=3152295 RepID=UPI00325E34A7